MRWLTSLSLVISLPALASEPAAPAALTPTRAYSQLVTGNARFAAGKSKRRDTPKVRKQLARGQTPHAVVLTCSDSRVPPELTFDQGLGKLFVVREAGNGLDPHAVASIEYAVEHLGAKLVVVMGHTSCSAVQAALSTPEGAAGSPSLDALLHDVRSNLATAELSDEQRRDPRLYQPVVANVEAVTKQLAALSALVRRRLDDGSLAVVSAVYALDTGRVEFWNNEKVR